MVLLFRKVFYSKIKVTLTFYDQKRHLKNKTFFILLSKTGNSRASLQCGFEYAAVSDATFEISVKKDP